MTVVDDVTRFTEGDCWFLMLEFNRVTGWPCYAFWRRIDDGEGYIEACCHGFILTPTGDFLDVEGLWTEEQMTARYFEEDDPDYFGGITEWPRSEFIGCEEEFEGSKARARKLAPRLLDKHGLRE